MQPISPILLKMNRRGTLVALNVTRSKCSRGGGDKSQWEKGISTQRHPNIKEFTAHIGEVRRLSPLSFEKTDPLSDFQKTHTIFF